ncbi:MAG: hypothetical protein M1281_01965 [Chloroflexi bacterium]|nr:hypothetical protein [Chloroflexota bacterium]
MVEPHQLSERIISAFIAAGEHRGAAEDIAYHLTNWKPELDRFNEIWEHPDQLSDDELRRIILDFLRDVPDHLSLAKRLSRVGLIGDIFKTGPSHE